MTFVLVKFIRGFRKGKIIMVCRVQISYATWKSVESKSTSWAVESMSHMGSRKYMYARLLSLLLDSKHSFCVAIYSMTCF